MNSKFPLQSILEDSNVKIELSFVSKAFQKSTSIASAVRTTLSGTFSV